MYDTGKIITGLAVFTVLAASPLLLNLSCLGGKAAYKPDPKIVTQAKRCVAAKGKMVSSHMRILDGWRNSVVRDGNRTYVTRDGREFNMSLCNTCMECHSNKADFCDQCHNYAGVSPYCWDCHVAPKEKK